MVILPLAAGYPEAPVSTASSQPPDAADAACSGRPDRHTPILFDHKRDG